MSMNVYGFNQFNDGVRMSDFIQESCISRENELEFKSWGCNNDYTGVKCLDIVLGKV